MPIKKRFGAARPRRLAAKRAQNPHKTADAGALPALAAGCFTTACQPGTQPQAWKRCRFRRECRAGLRRKLLPATLPWRHSLPQHDARADEGAKHGMASGKNLKRPHVLAPPVRDIYRDHSATARGRRSECDAREAMRAAEAFLVIATRSSTRAIPQRT